MMNKENERFITLDVFRGMTIFLMIIVNTPGGGAIPYSPLEHAEWHGCTLTDLVFPSFLFAVGNAMSFSMKKFATLPQKKVLFKIGKRTLLIFVVGYLLTWYTTMHFDNGTLVFSDFAQNRLMAVLQRIALCYCIAALMVYYFSTRSVVILSIILLLSYWMMLFIFGEPGIQYTITGNAVRRLDLAVIGERHMYRERGIVFDPEGLLSTIPATVNVLAGYLAGVFIIQKQKTYETVAKLAMAGALLMLMALSWNYFLPMNKKLWTSSYVVYTTGIDLIALGTLFYAIEIKRWKTGVAFFSVFGKNPLFIYVLSNLFLIFLIMKIVPGKVFIDWINEVFFQEIAPGPFGSLLFAISFTLVCWSIGWILDKKRIYIRM
ncbi:MAG: heparan-alpha-glucosaminide N-acetyltransferase domain-containing protein [Ginsengibacter sp.]